MCMKASICSSIRWCSMFQIWSQQVVGLLRNPLSFAFHNVVLLVGFLTHYKFLFTSRIIYHNAVFVCSLCSNTVFTDHDMGALWTMWDIVSLSVFYNVCHIWINKSRINPLKNYDCHTVLNYIFYSRIFQLFPFKMCLALWSVIFLLVFILLEMKKMFTTYVNYILDDVVKHERSLLGI
jgi:hypothetical protein